MALRAVASSSGGGGGGNPGGSTTQLQYNNAGAFGGITGATTNGTFVTLVTPVLGVASATVLNVTGTSGIATGIGRSTTNTLGFYSNGSLKATVNASGASFGPIANDGSGPMEVWTSQMGIQFVPGATAGSTSFIQTNYQTSDGVLAIGTFTHPNSIEMAPNGDVSILQGGLYIGTGQKFTLGNNAVSGLTPGALAALTTSSLVIYDNAGNAYRVPAITP